MTAVRARITFRQRLLPRGLVTAGLVLGGGVLLGYLLAGRGVATAGAVIALPAVTYLLVRKPTNGLVCGLVLILALPYWYSVGTPQAAIFRIAVLMAVVSCLFAYHVRLTVVDLSVLAVVAVTVLSWLFRDDQAGVGRILFNQLLPLGFFIAARTISRDEIPRVMRAAFLAGTLGATSVLYEAFVGHAIFIDSSSYSWNATESTIFRAGGIFGSPPGAATALALTALFGLPGLRTLTGRSRVFAWFCFLLTVTACVLTFTRASVIGLVAGLIAYLWLSRSSLFSVGRLAIGGVTVGVVLALALPTLESSTRFQRGVVRPGNVAIRQAYWRLALPITVASPGNLFFGVGSMRTLVARQGGAIPEELAATPSLITHGTHNQYVLALLEQGILGLGALLAWLGTTLAIGLREGRRSEDCTRAALVGSVGAFAIVMLANNAMLHPPSLAIGAFASGLLVASWTNRGSGATASRQALSSRSTP